MKKTKEELNKYSWHRLYKIVLWLGSISVGIFTTIKAYDFDEVVFCFIFWSVATFLAIFLIYRFILYITIGGKIFFSRKERKYFITAIFILVLIITIAFIYFNYFYVEPDYLHPSSNLDLDLDLDKNLKNH